MVQWNCYIQNKNSGKFVLELLINFCLLWYDGFLVAFLPPHTSYLFSGQLGLVLVLLLRTLNKLCREKFAIILLKKCTLDHFRNWKSGIYVWREAPNVNKVCQCFWSLMSRIECRYCSITTAYLTGLFAIFILLHI